MSGMTARHHDSDVSGSTWRPCSLASVGVAEPSTISTVASRMLWSRITERVDLLICPAHAPGLVPGHHVPDVQGVRSPRSAAPGRCARRTWHTGLTMHASRRWPPASPPASAVDPQWGGSAWPALQMPTLVHPPVDEPRSLSAPAFAAPRAGGGVSSPLVRHRGVGNHVRGRVDGGIDAAPTCVPSASASARSVRSRRWDGVSGWRCGGSSRWRERWAQPACGNDEYPLSGMVP
jgi:hypothetical protein